MQTFYKQRVKCLCAFISKRSLISQKPNYVDFSFSSFVLLAYYKPHLTDLKSTELTHLKSTGLYKVSKQRRSHTQVEWDTHCLFSM